MKFKICFLLLTMVLFTASVSNASSFDNHKASVRTEACINLQAVPVQTIDVVLTSASYDVTVYSFEIAMPSKVIVPQINDRGNIDRWCKQERIRLCAGFINSLSNPPNQILRS